jgi:hypothetical protein
LLGCVWIEPLNEYVWYLGSLATDPTRQNSGLGKILLSAAEQCVRDRGGKRIRMHVVNVRKALIAWYVRRGYAKTGETEPFPYGDDRFGAPLRDDLSFLVLDKDLTLSDSGNELERRQKRVGALVCRRRHTRSDNATGT